MHIASEIASCIWSMLFACISSIIAIGVVVDAQLSVDATAQAQQKHFIRGMVVDDSTNRPIVNANVFISNSMMGASSDSSGHFVIKNVLPGVHELVASCMGYTMISITVRVEDTTATMIVMRLKAKVISLNVVEIVAKRPAVWHERLKKFTDLLLGSTPEASQCEIMNAGVLQFYENGSTGFDAQCTQELIVENLALGYRLHLALGSFRFNGRSVSASWKVVYHDLSDASPRQMLDWEKSRKRAYYGSLRHFLRRLVNGDASNEGFRIFSSSTPDVFQTGRPSLPELDGQNLLRQVGPNEVIIQFDRFLVVKYMNSLVEMGTDRWGRTLTRPKTSVLALVKGSLRINSYGQILDQLAVKVLGDWGNEGLARDLPLEFRPKKSAKDEVN